MTEIKIDVILHIHLCKLNKNFANLFDFQEIETYNATHEELETREKRLMNDLNNRLKENEKLRKHGLVCQVNWQVVFIIKPALCKL